MIEGMLLFFSFQGKGRRDSSASKGSCKIIVSSWICFLDKQVFLTSGSHLWQGFSSLTQDNVSAVLEPEGILTVCHVFPAGFGLSRLGRCNTCCMHFCAAICTEIACAMHSAPIKHDKYDISSTAGPRIKWMTRYKCLQVEDACIVLYTRGVLLTCTGSQASKSDWTFLKARRFYRLIDARPAYPRHDQKQRAG